MMSDATQIKLPADYIPYAIRAKITQIDPNLDIFWQQHLQNIFAQLSATERQNVAHQILKQKNIFFNAETKQFEYRADSVPSLAQVVNAIPVAHKKLKVLANQILQSIDKLQSEYNEAEKIADYLENILEKIQEFDAQNDLEQNNHKQKLYRAFIYASANIIRQKNDWVLPENKRKLHSNAVKVFINEVFLKHKLLGYGFKTLRQRQLRESHDPLINDFLANEQRGRQLEVVQASSYLFAIAPMLEYNSNPFGIRRFLSEDRLFGGSVLLFGVAHNTAFIAGSRPEWDDFFRKQIECIITIQGNVRQLVLDFMEKLDVFHEERLLPLLFSPFNTDAGSLHREVSKRLQEYEKLLTVGILEPLAQSLRQLPNHADEFDYMYVSTRQLLGKIIAALQDFQTLPALLLDEQAQLLTVRVIAYTTLLERRRSDIFAEIEQRAWSNFHKQTLLPIQHARSVAKTHLTEYRERKHAVNQQQAVFDKPAGMLDKLFKRKESQERELNELKKRLRQVQYDAYQALCYPPEEVLRQMVRLEFDAEYVGNPEERTFAFPMGDNGVSKLPMILTLPQNRLQFDVNAFAKFMGVGEHDDDEETVLHEAEKVLLKRT